MYVFGPSGFWTMAPLRYPAKFDPFLSLDCAPTPSTLAQSKERKGSNFANWQPWGQDNYVPEDLISLLDAGINADNPSVIIDADAMFSDDAMFGYSQARSRLVLQTRFPKIRSQEQSRPFGTSNKYEFVYFDALSWPVDKSTNHKAPSH